MPKILHNLPKILHNLSKILPKIIDINLFKIGGGGEFGKHKNPNTKILSKIIPSKRQFEVSAYSLALSFL